MSQEQVELLRLYISDPSGNEFFNDPKLEEFITANTFDGVVNLNAAASKLWAIKAGNVATWYTASMDGSFLSREQVFEHCLRMAAYYGSEGGGDPASWKSIEMDSEGDNTGEPAWEF